MVQVIDSFSILVGELGTGDGLIASLLTRFVVEARNKWNKFNFL